MEVCSCIGYGCRMKFVNEAREKIKASFKDGLLSIDIPKVEQEKPKKVSVKIG